MFSSTHALLTLKVMLLHHISSDMRWDKPCNAVYISLNKIPKRISTPIV
jgi:hypothetical protein